MMGLLDFLFHRTPRRRDPVKPRRCLRTCQLVVEALESRTLLTSATTQVFLTRLYQDLLHRNPDTAGLATFGSALDTGTISRSRAAQIFESSSEYRNVQVDAAYQKFLHRSADAGGLSYFAGFLAVGGALEQVDAALAGSTEYFTNRGSGTNDGFLDALFQDTLGRAAEPAAHASLVPQLANESRSQLALSVLTSAEYRQDLVQTYYQQFLHRSADPGGLTTFTTALQQGRLDQQVVAIIVSSEEYAPGAAGPVDPPGVTLTAAETGQLLQRAAAASVTNDAIIAIVDRGGRVLGVRVESGVSPQLTADPNLRTFAIDGALAEARSGAFFANNQAPITSRTVQFLSQSTMTQREVDSLPEIQDQNSPLRGPGFVAAVGIGGHFPPGVQFTPSADLFEIEHTNRDTTYHPAADGVVNLDPADLLPERFNANPAFVPPGQELTPPDSYGYISGIAPTAEPRGIGTLPGGIPIFKNGQVVGGIGVFFPGATGFASAENSSLDVRYNPALPDRSLEAEYIAFAAVGGSAGAGASIGALGGVPPLPGFDLPFGRIDLAGITLNIFGPGGTQGPGTLLSVGRSLGVGNPNDGVNEPVDRFGDALLAGRAVPEGWLVAPHAGVGITAADVIQMVNQGIVQAEQTRAAIRLPIGSRTSMVFAVADSTGEVLGLYRMPDATVFSIDVAVAKARNVAYYANPSQLQPIDTRDPLGPNGSLGLPAGAALTNRTFRYLAQPRYPEGIDGRPPGPFSQLLDDPIGINAGNGVQVGARLPAAAFLSVVGHDSFFPESNFHDPFNLLNQNGIVFFPGSTPIYKSFLVGGYGVSGDGVNQDDVVTFGGMQGFQAPGALRADQFLVRGVRLPFQNFDRNPTG